MKIGMAFGGGGLRGAAHIGVLQELLENNIVPDLVAGTSAGSIIGSFFAVGMTPKQMIHILSYLPKLSKGQLERALEPPQAIALTASFAPKLPMGIISSQFLEALLLRALGKVKFDQLLVPLAVVTADLYNGQTVIYTSRKQSFNFPSYGNFALENNAYVHEAVTASCAIPGIFTPKTIGNRTLIDGGLVDNVPADILKAMGADVIIGVDLGFGVEQPTPFKHLIDILLQTYDIMGQRIVNVITGQYADITVKPSTTSTALYEFQKIPSLIEAGRAEAHKMMPQIKECLAKAK